MVHIYVVFTSCSLTWGLCSWSWWAGCLWPRSTFISYFIFLSGVWNI